MNQFIFMPHYTNYQRYSYHTLTSKDVCTEATALGIIGTSTAKILAPAFINLYESLQDDSSTIKKFSTKGRTLHRDLGISYTDPIKYLPAWQVHQYRILVMKSNRHLNRFTCKSHLKNKEIKDIKDNNYELIAFQIGSKQELLYTKNKENLPDSTYLYIQIVNKEKTISRLLINLDESAYLNKNTLFITHDGSFRDQDGSSFIKSYYGGFKNASGILLGVLDVSRPLDFKNSDMQSFIQKTIKYTYEYGMYYNSL